MRLKFDESSLTHDYRMVNDLYCNDILQWRSLPKSFHIHHDGFPDKGIENLITSFLSEVLSDGSVYIQKSSDFSSIWTIIYWIFFHHSVIEIIYIKWLIYKASIFEYQPLWLILDHLWCHLYQSSRKEICTRVFRQLRTSMKCSCLNINVPFFLITFKMGCCLPITAFLSFQLSVHALH